MSTSASQPGMTPELAAAYREIMCQGLLNECEITKKVLGAVPDAKRDYRPDPKARTAWELAWHIAKEDVLFLDQIAEGKFTMPDPRFDKETPNTIAELVTWYDKNFRRALQSVRAMTTAQLATPINFVGLFNLPGVLYLGSSTTIACIIVGSWRPISGPWGRRCLRSMAAAPTSLSRCRQRPDTMLCHPERARPTLRFRSGQALARESKDPYGDETARVGGLRLVRAKAARTRSA